MSPVGNHPCATFLFLWLSSTAISAKNVCSDEFCTSQVEAQRKEITEKGSGSDESSLLQTQFQRTLASNDGERNVQAEDVELQVESRGEPVYPDHQSNQQPYTCGHSNADDCLAEYSHGINIGNLEPFCNLCATEAVPFWRNRCKKCCDSCQACGTDISGVYTYAANNPTTVTIAQSCRTGYGAWTAFLPHRTWEFTMYGDIPMIHPTAWSHTYTSGTVSGSPGSYVIVWSNGYTYTQVAGTTPPNMASSYTQRSDQIDCTHMDPYPADYPAHTSALTPQQAKDFCDMLGQTCGGFVFVTPAAQKARTGHDIASAYYCQPGRFQIGTPHAGAAIGYEKKQPLR